MFELKFNVFSLLISISLIIGITFGLLLFSRRKNNKVDRFLASLMFVVALWNASILILSLDIYRYVEGIIWVPLTFRLALGPCFYFYVRYLTDTKLTFKSKIWPHFIPVFFEVCLYLLEVFQGLPLGIGYFQTETFIVFDPLINALAIASVMVYGYFARKDIYHYHHWVKNNYSHYHRYNLSWLSRLSSTFLYFLTVWLCYFLFDYFLFNYQLSISDYYPFHLALAFISIWLSVEAFFKPDIIFPDKIDDLSNDNKSNSAPDEEIQEKANWLKEQIEQNLLYLDPELSLRSLADTLSIHPSLASKIINDGLKQTFSDCINEYRVKAVITKLKNNQNEKLNFLAIAFESGFNSKTTFNRIFKKQMGLTPLQFRNSLNKD